MGMWIKRALRVLIAGLALLLIVLGLRWLIDPGGISPLFGFRLESGLGLSSQVGDLSAFFLVAGLCVLFALVSYRKIWYYPAAMLLFFAATGRTVAWVIHGADFALEMIIFEVVVASLFLAGSRVLAEG